MPQAAHPQQNTLVYAKYGGELKESGLQFSPNSEFILQWQCSLFQFLRSAVISSETQTTERCGSSSAGHEKAWYSFFIYVKRSEKKNLFFFSPWRIVQQHL